MDHPLTAEFCAALRRSMLPFLADGIDTLSAKPGYRDSLEEILGLLRRGWREKPWPKWAANGTLRFNRTVLQEELSFRKSGQYSRTPEDSVAVNAEVYQSTEVMEGYYLVGLLLSYFTWIHHDRMLEFYRTRFLRDGGSANAVMEWGIGHGLFALLAARVWPAARMTAVDISEHSLDFARRLFEAAGETSRVTFVTADILGCDATFEPVDRLICSELMEHVADPRLLLTRISAALMPGGRAFVTTAINAPQPDHIYLFRSRDEVEQLVAASGLIIEEAISLVHPHNEGRVGAPTVLAMIAVKACG